MTNDQMTNDEGSGARPRIYDLAERTAVFGEKVIDFVATIRVTPLTRPLISQLIRAATSIGANYCEADDADSPKDFRYKIGLCRKESRETKYWFRMLSGPIPTRKTTPDASGRKPTNST